MLHKILQAAQIDVPGLLHLCLTLKPFLTIQMKQAPDTDLDKVISLLPIDQGNVEKELEWKTQMLQDYVDNAVIGLHWVDENGIIKWANKAELDMLGYTAEEYIGHHISKFHVYENKISDILYKLSCNQALNQYESELRCKDGTIKTVHISSNVFWHEGKFIHTRCFTVDVTETKKLIDALSQSESRYRRLVNSLATPLYTTDSEGKITMFNKAAAELWGREPEVGKDMWSGSYKTFNIDGSEIPLDNCPMATCLRERRGVNAEEILIMRPDGSIRSVVPHPQPLFDDKGNMIGAINMLIDITTIKQTEIALRESEIRYKELTALLEKKIEEKTADLKLKNEQLQRSEERYHKMIEEVEDYAIILLDKNGVIQNWNKGAEKIKGYKEEEIVGRNFSTFYLPEDRAAGLPERTLKEARKNGKALYEGWRLRKNGSRFWGSIVLTALHDRGDNIIGFSKVTRDLTQKKLAEDSMEEYTRQLEFKNRELEQFTYAASHDMKEPLRKIAFYVSVVSENLEGKIDEKSAEYLQRSIAAAKRMNSLIEDLLTYARTNGSEEYFEKVDLNEAVDQVILQHKDEFEQKPVRFEKEKLGTISGIPFQIHQLLDNLITNSVKYKHPERNCVIRIKGQVATAAKASASQLSNHKQYYHLSISDNGLGFDPEYAEKIFEIFQRLHNAPNTTGSGIGLAICKRIVENHNGVITATGQQDKGARFDIYLPLEKNQLHTSA